MYSRKYVFILCVVPVLLSDILESTGNI